MAISVLLSVLVNVIISTALPTSEFVHYSTSTTEIFHLTSRDFPSTPPAYTWKYNITCSLPQCRFQFQFMDLDLFPGSEIKIRDEGSYLTLFHFIQNVTYVSARPLFTSDSGSVSVFVNMTRPYNKGLHTGCFKAYFTTIKEGYQYPSAIPWESREPIRGCPEFNEYFSGELRMYAANREQECVIALKGPPVCNLYLRVIDITGGGVAEVIRGNTSGADGARVTLDHVHQFVRSKDGLYIRFREGIEIYPKRLIFEYGCFGEIRPSSRTSKCEIKGLGLDHGGVPCNDNLCLFTNGSPCDGIYHCPDGEDENPVTCPWMTTTDWPGINRRTGPSVRWHYSTTRRSVRWRYPTTQYYPTTRPSVRWHYPTTRRTYSKSEPTEHAAGQSPFIYIVYALVPLLILIMIGCIFYRMTLRARDVFGRRLVYPHNNYYDGYEEHQPPPDYDVALTHPKPVVDPSLALPTYDESNADRAPAYEDIFPDLPPGPSHQPPPGAPPPTMEMYTIPVVPLSFNSTVSSSDNMPRLLTRYSQVDISPPAMPILPEDTSAAMPNLPEDTSAAMPILPEDTSAAMPILPEDTSAAMPILPEDTSPASSGTPDTQGAQPVQQHLDITPRLDSEEHRTPEPDQKDETSSVESGGIVESSRL